MRYNKKYIALTFRDNGIGFDNVYNKKIFEVFRHLYNSSAYSGTGIGLSIVDKILMHTVERWCSC